MIEINKSFIHESLRSFSRCEAQCSGQAVVSNFVRSTPVLPSRQFLRKETDPFGLSFVSLVPHIVISILCNLLYSFSDIVQRLIEKVNHNCFFSSCENVTQMKSLNKRRDSRARWKLMKWEIFNWLLRLAKATFSVAAGILRKLSRTSLKLSWNSCATQSFSSIMFIESGNCKPTETARGWMNAIRFFGDFKPSTKRQSSKWIGRNLIIYSNNKHQTLIWMRSKHFISTSKEAEKKREKKKQLCDEKKKRNEVWT